MQRTEEGKPQVALVTLGDSRREFYQQRIAIVEEEMQKAKTALEKCFTVYQSPIVYSDAEAEAVARQIRGRGIGAVVIHLPIWAPRRWRFGSPRAPNARSRSWPTSERTVPAWWSCWRSPVCWINVQSLASALRGR